MEKKLLSRHQCYLVWFVTNENHINTIIKVEPFRFDSIFIKIWLLSNQN